MFGESYRSNKVMSKKNKRAGCMAQTSQVFKRELSFLTVEFSFKLHIVLFQVYFIKSC